MIKKLFLAAPVALASAALLAAPASAASLSNPGQIRAEIQQLHRQIDRAPGLSDREERRLDGQVDRLQQLYQSYARGGFSRGELQRLDRELASVKLQIVQQARDGKGRSAGRDQHSGHDDGRNRNDHRR